MWQRNLRSRTIQVVCVLFIALLMSVSSRANVTEEFSYENIFGSDSGGGEQLSTDNLLAPFIVLGISAGEIFVNIRPDLSIASIEKAPFLKNTKTYLNPSIYKQFEAIDTDYLVLEDMPEGITIIMDENLSVRLELIPEVMSDMSPQMYMDTPALRDSKRTKARSLISDITLKYENEEFTAGIDQRLRMGNVYGFARNNIGKDSELFADYYVGYEAQDYDILVGNIRPRSFAGVYAESNLGVALTNSLLRGSVVLESNPRYININHASTVKIYINDVLEETKEYKPGRHRLNIPLNMIKSNIKVEIIDKYGREEVIVFNFAGRYAHNIPSSEQVLYFLGVGEHALTHDIELYAGVELGIDTLSKIQLASLLSSEIQLIGGQYFIARKFGTNETYLTLSHKDSFGVILKNYTNIYWEKL